MEETLARILEKYAEKSEKHSRRNLDSQRKAYIAGKAEGLRQALEKYAEKSEKHSRRNLDSQRKAYIAGKAEGLRQAKAMFYMLAECSPARSGELTEAR